MHYITPFAWYTKLDAECDKQATVGSRSIVDNTSDNDVAGERILFSKSGVSGKLQSELPLFLKNFLKRQCTESRISRDGMENSMPKSSCLR